MQQKNKVKYSICNVHYAMLNIDENENISYCKPIPLLGAVALSLMPLGEDPLISSNGSGFVQSNNIGYKGSLETALLSSAFCVDVLNETIDKNGVLVENSYSKLSPFALLFEFEGDAKKIRHVFYNCYASRTSVSSSSVKGLIDVQTETVDIYALPLEDGLVKAKTDVNTSADVYENWYEEVYVPNNNSMEE